VVSEEFSWVGLRAGEEDGDRDEYVSPIKRSASVSGEAAIAPATAAMTRVGMWDAGEIAEPAPREGVTVSGPKFHWGLAQLMVKLGPKFLCSIFRFYLGRSILFVF
jgi:hypothetical protein